MSKKRGGRQQRLNHLLAELRPGQLVPAGWINQRFGIPAVQLPTLVSRHWLEKPARGVYCRPGVWPDWRDVVASLRTLDYPVHIGGREAVEFHGMSHFIREPEGPVSTGVYCDVRLPAWVAEIDPEVEIARRRSPVRDGALGIDLLQGISDVGGLPVASPERAVLEALDGVPAEVDFREAHEWVGALTTARPKLVQQLLESTPNFRIRRIFLWCVHHHGHAWLSRLDLRRIDLGKGKRRVVANGRYDSRFGITVPRELADAETL